MSSSKVSCRAAFTDSSSIRRYRKKRKRPDENNISKINRFYKRFKKEEFTPERLKKEEFSPKLSSNITTKSDIKEYTLTNPTEKQIEEISSHSKLSKIMINIDSSKSFLSELDYIAQLKKLSSNSAEEIQINFETTCKNSISDFISEITSNINLVCLPKLQKIIMIWTDYTHTQEINHITETSCINNDDLAISEICALTQNFLIDSPQCNYNENRPSAPPSYIFSSLGMEEIVDLPTSQDVMSALESHRSIDSEDEEYDPFWGKEDPFWGKEDPFIAKKEPTDVLDSTEKF